jgi:hypothetical protein
MNPNFQYRVRNNSPLDPILTQSNMVYEPRNHVSARSILIIAFYPIQISQTASSSEKELDSFVPSVLQIGPTSVSLILSPNVNGKPVIIEFYLFSC